MCNVMAEKQDIREDQMTVSSSVDYVRGMKGKNSVLIRPGNLPHPNTGGQVVNGIFIKGKWYRIAIGRDGTYPCSGIFNIGNRYNNAYPTAVLFYVFASGYYDKSFISKLASSDVVYINKARVLYGENPLISYLDIYVIGNIQNEFYISASCLMNFKLQTPEEVGKTIPEGYSVKEVSF